eukprot:5429692-Pleurochrysis_carterae.AAC.1
MQCLTVAYWDGTARLDALERAERHGRARAQVAAVRAWLCWMHGRDRATRPVEKAKRERAGARS